MEGQLRDTASKSSLSSWVKNLLCKVGCDNTSTEEGYQPNSDLALDQDSDVDHCPKKLQSNSMPRIVTNNSQILNNGHIDMELLTALLPEYIEPPTEYFMKAVTRLAPVFQKCKEYLAGHRPNEFAYKYEDNFSWTKNKKLFLQCFELLTDTKGPDELLALLLLCGGLERALRNLYCLKGNQCPALLKDLLCTSELESYLGTAAIKILHVVIGPPTSMNLRNVSWHGFLKESELPRRYIFFLLLFTASVGKLLQNRGISMDSIQCRGYVSLSKVNDIAKHLGAVHLDVLALGNCILQSWLVDQGNINVFKSAFAFFAEQKLVHHQ